MCRGQKVQCEYWHNSNTVHKLLESTWSFVLVCVNVFTSWVLCFYALFHHNNNNIFLFSMCFQVILSGIVGLTTWRRPMLLLVRDMVLISSIKQWLQKSENKCMYCFIPNMPNSWRVNGNIMNTVQRWTCSDRRELINRSFKSEIPGGENVKSQWHQSSASNDGRTCGVAHYLCLFSCLKLQSLRFQLWLSSNFVRNPTEEQLLYLFTVQPNKLGLFQWKKSVNNKHNLCLILAAVFHSNVG